MRTYTKEELSNLFDEAIEKASFSEVELLGFAAKPILAIKAGVAVGYMLALEDEEHA